MASLYRGRRRSEKAPAAAAAAMAMAETSDGRQVEVVARPCTLFDDAGSPPPLRGRTQSQSQSQSPRRLPLLLRRGKAMGSLPPLQPPPMGLPPPLPATKDGRRGSFESLLLLLEDTFATSSLKRSSRLPHSHFHSLPSYDACSSCDACSRRQTTTPGKRDSGSLTVEPTYRASALAPACASPSPPTASLPLLLNTLQFSFDDDVIGSPPCVDENNVDLLDLFATFDMLEQKCSGCSENILPWQAPTRIHFAFPAPPKSLG